MKKKDSFKETYFEFYSKLKNCLINEKVYGLRVTELVHLPELKPNSDR